MGSFVDLQLNGYCGTDFSSLELTRAGIESACAELFARGTGAFLATVITTGMDVYEHALPLLAEAIENPPAGARILGIHMEGPFISREEGAVGAHPPQHVQAPDIALLNCFLELCCGHLKLLTVAPEASGVQALIRAACDAGVLVSTGHSLAADEDVQRAAEAGATLITHLGNGCPASINRHKNPIYAQLSSGLQPMLITDSFHLPPSFIKIVCMAVGRDGVIVTSDASPVGGLPPGEYQTMNVPVVLEESGLLHCRDNEYLAGSSACMRDCLNWLAGQGWTESELWTVGRDNPLRVLDMAGDSIPDAGVTWEGSHFEC